MRSFRAMLGLLCFLLVVVTYQPFRDIARGRAGEQALAGPPATLQPLPPRLPGTTLWSEGTLRAAPDVRRDQPVIAAPDTPLGALLGAGQDAANLPPGALLAANGEGVPLEGERIGLAGRPADYPYGSRVAVYGVPGDDEFEVWALAPDAAGLRGVAERQTRLLRWPAALLGLGIALLGSGLAVLGGYLLIQAIRPGARLRPRLVAAAFALYILIGFLLLGSAWAMLWPMVGGAALSAALAWRAAARSAAPSP